MRLAILASLTLLTCAGPERVPHQPIPGIDTERNEVRTAPTSQPSAGEAPGPTAVPAATPRPAPVAPVPPSGANAEPGVLADFARELAAAHQLAPGVVAVFPALSRSEQSRSQVVTGLGEYLMTATADALEAEGVHGVLAGDGLVNDIRAANRGLDAWRGNDDVHWIADRLGAAYVVYGTADVQSIDALAGQRNLEVRWQAVRIADRTTVARWRPSLSEGPFAQRLLRLQQTPSDWRIGAAAEPFQPSLQLEARLLGRQLAQRLANEQAALLRGKYVRVEPTIVSGRSGARAELQNWAAEFERKLDVAIGKVASNGDLATAEKTALQTGPIAILGREYANFGDALDTFRELRSRVDTTALGDLEQDIAASLAEQLRETMHQGVHVLADEAEREAMLAVLRRQARAARSDDSVDAATLTQLKANGAQTVITTTLRRDLETYVLRATLLDLGSGTKVSASTNFETAFRDGLDQALNR